MTELLAESSGGDARALDAIAFAVSADLVYNVFSATNSSPQTTELFAGDRSATLWKYVRLGGVQSVILVGIMSARGRTAWAAFGGLVAGGFMWGMYAHALRSGQASASTPPRAAPDAALWRGAT